MPTMLMLLQQLDLLPLAGEEAFIEFYYFI
jgi:hypothetical protein